jgi:hypothetical protein
MKPGLIAGAKPSDSSNMINNGLQIGKRLNLGGMFLLVALIGEAGTF